MQSIREKVSASLEKSKNKLEKETKRTIFFKREEGPDPQLPDYIQKNIDELNEQIAILNRIDELLDSITSSLESDEVPNLEHVMELDAFSKQYKKMENDVLNIVESARVLSE